MINSDKTPPGSTLYILKKLISVPCILDINSSVKNHIYINDNTYFEKSDFIIQSTIMKKSISLLTKEWGSCTTADLELDEVSDLFARGAGKVVCGIQSSIPNTQEAEKCQTTGAVMTPSLKTELLHSNSFPR